VLVNTEVCVGDVRDMALGHLLAAERGRRGQAYLLGQENVALPDLVSRWLTLAGQEKQVVEVPTRVLLRAARAAEALARLTRRPPPFTRAAVRIAQLGLRADCGKARRELGLPGRPLEVSLGDALGWFRAQGAARGGRRAG
jgi:dihydroflavonol-4-reductase